MSARNVAAVVRRAAGIAMSPISASVSRRGGTEGQQAGGGWVEPELEGQEPAGAKGLSVWETRQRGRAWTGGRATWGRRAGGQGEKAPRSVQRKQAAWVDLQQDRRAGARRVSAGMEAESGKEARRRRAPGRPAPSELA